jgi:membrane-associated phospholipid phosphatase
VSAGVSGRRERRYHEDVDRDGTGFARRIDALAVLLSITTWVLLGAIYLLSVATTFGLSLDAAVARRAAGVGWQPTAQLLSALLNDITTVLAVVGLGTLAVIRGRWREALGLLVIVGAAGATASGFKSLLSTADPLRGEMARSLGAGFYPSGHAAAAMALVLGALLVAPTWRRQLILLGGAWCSIHGFVIVVNRQHHFSDVLGGFLLAAAVAGLVAIVPRLGTPTATAEVRLSVRAIVKVVAAVVVAAPLLEAMHRFGLPIADRLHVLLIVAAVISALAFVLIAAFGLLLDRPLRT